MLIPLNIEGREISTIVPLIDAVVSSSGLDRLI